MPLALGRPLGRCSRVNQLREHRLKRRTFRMNVWCAVIKPEVAGLRVARRPPILRPLSKTVTPWPCPASRWAHESPATPAPTTAIRLVIPPYSPPAVPSPPFIVPDTSRSAPTPNGERCTSSCQVRQTRALAWLRLVSVAGLSVVITPTHGLSIARAPDRATRGAIRLNAL